MERPQVQLPLQKAAFDDPGTRAAWTRLRRRARTRLILCTVVWVAVFVAISVLDGFGVIALSEVGGTSRTGGRSDLLGGVLTLTLIVYILVLSLCLRSLRCLKRIRAVLERHPWQTGPSVHRQPGIKDANGVAVRLRFANEPVKGRDDLMSAQAPLFRRRWPEAMERGAWYAGDINGQGVLAVPGGDSLMEIKPRR